MDEIAHLLLEPEDSIGALLLAARESYGGTEVVLIPLSYSHSSTARDSS